MSNLAAVGETLRIVGQPSHVISEVSVPGNRTPAVSTIAYAAFVETAKLLIDAVGSAAVTTDPADLEFYASDIYEAGPEPAAVVLPTDIEMLSRALAAVAPCGAAIVPRGGGVSYTGGIVPPSGDAIVVDTSGMNRIVHIDKDDMYVTVEAGCTWRRLWETLDEFGLRVPFWGPLSGGRATVGGSVSQGAALWGSGRYGTSSESVLGLRVVVADGSIVTTGMEAIGGATPSWRHFGPDLTGLFLGDAGALGVKGTITLRLMRTPAEQDFLSFTFADRSEIVDAMSELARADLVVAGFGLDPTLTEQRVRRGSLAQGVDAVRSMVGRSTNRLAAVREAARMAAKGRGFLAPDTYTLHVVAEARSRRAVEDDIAEIRRACSAGDEVEATVPRLLASHPFASLTSALGPEGQRWAPLHVLVPLSDANAMCDTIDGFKDRHGADMDTHQVEMGYMFSTISTTTMLVEAVMTWPGPRPVVYDRLIDTAKLGRYPNYEPDPEAAAFVAGLRSELVDLFAAAGGAHLQIGRRYRYHDRLDPTTLRLLTDLKAAVDPDGRMNPGALGLDRPTTKRTTTDR